MRILIAALLLLAATALPATAAPPEPFTARYQLLKNGKPMGTTQMRLRRDGQNWLFTTDTEGTRGLAGLAGLTIHESSRFRMRDGAPEVLRHRYRLAAGPVRRNRALDVDWSKGEVHVVRDDKTWNYRARPGMVDKHMLPWVLGRGLTPEPHAMHAIVAVRDRAETQHYLVTGRETIELPIGTVSAIVMDRNDPGRDFTAWYMPGRYPVPIRLDHDEYSLQLASCSTP